MPKATFSGYQGLKTHVPSKSRFQSYSWPDRTSDLCIQTSWCYQDGVYWMALLPNQSFRKFLFRSFSCCSLQPAIPQNMTAKYLSPRRILSSSCCRLLIFPLSQMDSFKTNQERPGDTIYCCIL